MAPVATSKESNQPSKTVFKGTLDFTSLRSVVDQQKTDDTGYEFDFFKPTYPNVKWAPLEVFDSVDKATLADPNNNYANLFRNATSVTHLSHKIGTEIVGVSLADLDDTQKNELALLTARRVVVFFRDQKDLDIRKQLDLGRYFGRLHKHPTSGVPKGSKDGDLDEVLVVWANQDSSNQAALSNTRYWHSDVSYEKQPPAYTSLKLLRGPSSGGDTLWVSGYALYDSLSPGLRTYLENLTAIHSAKEQADAAHANGNPVRREAVITAHPVVRVHPVTGYKAVFVNPGFTRSIVGIPKAESDAILSYLFEIIATSQHATVRFKWNENDVAFWDNRVASHSATAGYFPERRHGLRVTAHGEVPYYDPKGKSQQAEIDAAFGLTSDLDGSKDSTYKD